MKKLRQNSIRHDLIRIIAIAAGAALFILVFSESIYNFLSYRKTMADDLIVQSRIIGLNSTAAILFEDRIDAEETLSALKEVPDVVYAAIYQENGKELATYRKKRSEGPPVQPLPEAEGHFFGVDHLSVLQPIIVKNESIGRIYVRATLKELYLDMAMHVLITIAIGIVSLSIGILLLTRLHKIITGPLLHLVSVMKTVSEGKDYSLRALVQGPEELRYLSEGFNEMLGQIRERDSELEWGRRHLEETVHIRTMELTAANEELKQEIIMRRETNELLENIFSNVHVLIAYMDTDFNFIRVNNRYAEADGQGPEFFIGKNHFDLYPNEENEEIFRKVVETGGPYFVNAKPFRHEEHPGRGTTFYDLNLRPVKDHHGKVRGLLLSLIDVTQNITLYTELMRANHFASLGKLAAGVAHEINNPINGIINYAQILLNKCDTGSKEHEIAGRIIKESDRIAGIVGNLLTFARDKKEEKRSTDLRAVLADSLALMETQLIKSGVKLNVHMSDDLPKVIANHQEIQQVFINVISNANYALNRKYHGAHEDKILEITGMRAELEGKPCARVIFHDHGTGIPTGISDRIMDPFFTTKYGDKGTGLGLSICHGIINDHEGNIRVESVEDVFTKIIIDLPAL